MASRHAPHFFRPGLGTFIILGVVFLGALMMTGGLIPSERKPSPSNYQTGELDIPPGSSSRYNLQLNTLKFKNITPPALPTAVPVVTATPTPTAPCTQTITLDFLLDISDSMNWLITPSSPIKKIDRLKEAVIAITQDLSDNSIIGIQAFNTNIINQQSQMDIIPISFYGSVRGIIPTKVNALSAVSGTPTKKALDFSYNKLVGALADPNFSGRKFNFILISDGRPDPPSQNPRLFIPNPADQIKSLANIEKVYTLGIYTAGQAIDQELKNLLISIASSPSNYYEAQSADQIQALLSAIKTNICN